MPTPPWVATSLAEILGLDTETIREVIIPDLEGYASEVRLRGHLQDFLGSTPAARAFSDRYIAYRFPSLAATVKPQILTPDPDLAKPKKTKNGTGSASRSAGPSGRATPTRTPTPSASIPDSLHAAFGTTGKLYQKHDEFALPPSRGGSGTGTHRSQPGSGAQTPVRRAGAVTITEVKKPAAKDKGKAKEEKIWDLPKSKEVLRLEKIVDDLRGLQAGLGKGAPSDAPPCFCQARVHPLSTYTPQCSSCGLILCSLQPAHAPCPSCMRPTLSPPALARLIQRVEGDVAAQLSHEQDERDEAERKRKERLLIASGGGAFPTLPGGAPRAPASAADAARRVLTINKPAKGKGRTTVTATTYTSTPASSKPKAKEPETPVDDSVPRPRSPPLDEKRVDKELAKALAWRDENDRPWADPKAERRGEMWDYIPPLVIELAGEEGTGRRRRARQKKAGVGVDGRVVVGAAR